MITIHNEITIDLGDPHRQDITLWLVSYGTPAHANMLKDWHVVIEMLRRFCARQGWLLETGDDDPYREKSLAVFDGGFSWPPDDENESSDDDPDWACDGMKQTNRPHTAKRLTG